MDIEKELKAIIEAKIGNKEMAVFFDPEVDYWTLALGNPTNCVMLGETSGEIEITGETLKDTIIKMKKVLKI